MSGTTKKKSTKVAGEITSTDNKIPPHVFPIPNSHIGFNLSGTQIFSSLRDRGVLFIRGGKVHEVTGAHGAERLAPVSPERFVSLIETFRYDEHRNYCVMRLDIEDGARKWRSTNFTKSAAEIVLKSNSASDYLHPINSVVSCPIVSKLGAGIQRHRPGYHPGLNGGTFILNCHSDELVPPDRAKAALLEIFKDFDFASPGDRSRAVASIISPALKMGGWINDDFPLDLAEADQSQSGKTYRQKIVAAVYNETPCAITSQAGGVGSLDEKVSSALIAGRPFIMLDNFRGKLNSTILESAIRGAGRIRCRALRMEAEIDCSPFLWQLSTNGAELTRDLANRSIITRIRKRPDDYKYSTHPEGDLLRHIKASQPFYLSCVFTVIGEWAWRGQPQTDESRHDFRGWCRALDWIVQNIFGLPPLLEGHREEQLRTANPKLQWLRDVINAALVSRDTSKAFSAMDIAELCEEESIHLPIPPRIAARASCQRGAHPRQSLQGRGRRGAARGRSHIPT